MASIRSSSPSPSSLPLPPPPPEIKYDVFLSFRGEDTRNNITSHLHKAFCDKGIDAFIDNQLRRGDEISPSLLQAIEESQIYVIIFSANYGNSRWCLEELVKILECKKYLGRIVIPVFYEIDPSHVRNQTGSYAVAFDSHEQRFKENLDRVLKWRCALKEAADLCGFDSRGLKPESKLVENVVEDVLKRLNSMRPCVNKDLVGMGSSIKELETMLGRGTVGIWGFGGIGKTTLAKALFDKISCQFDASYFVESVRDYESTSLRQKLLSKLLGDENAYFSTFNNKRLRSKMLLIVLDDVSNFRQVENLIGDLNYPGCKNRIIVTSRDKQVLKNCCIDDNIYEVKELCFSDALTLFCRNAFRQNHPNVDYMELSSSVVKIVGGVPLALKVLGSSLLGKTKKVWESAMKKLEKNFDRNIHKVLKISYKELDDDQRKIFLDIACFFNWWNVDLVKAFMEACDFFPDTEIDTLIDKSLITVSDNILTMHDLLQAMGKEIVRKESRNDPGKRSRLWHHKDVYDVLTNETGTKALEGISLDMSKSEDIYLRPRAFANMQNLRFLHFYASKHSENRVHVSQGLESIFTNLRYLSWYGCPLKSLQSNVLSKNLVVLTMINSKVKELWSGSPQLGNLKIIDLRESEHLTRLPDLSKATNLERLDLSDCTSLTEIPSSIQHLPKLQYIFLFNTSERHFCLESIPDCSGLKSLKKIVVFCCYKLKVAPKLPNNVEALDFHELTSLCEIPSSYKYLNKLNSLRFSRCESLTGIPDCSGFKSLTQLTIIGCSKVKMLPEFPNNIEMLQLVDIPIEQLPSSLENLCRLRSLDLSDCSRLKNFPSSVCKWKTLRTLRLTNCSKIDKLPDSLGCLTSLETLSLYNTNFESIPESIINLSKLRLLNISYCERLKVLPKLPWASVTAVNCTSLEQISCPSFRNDMFALDGGVIMIASFINCFKLDRNSLDNFAKDSLLEIRGQAASIKKITYQQVDQEFPPPITIHYPGDEIPVWFEYQNRGSFIDVNLPPNWFNYNFLCFALCIVVAIQDRQFVHHGENLGRHFLVRCACSAKSKDGDRRAVIDDELRWGDHSKFSMFDLTSNHVQIGFGFHFFSELYADQLSFQFYLVPISDGKSDKILNIDNYMVEKCGVHLMYGQHLKILDEEEEEEPHPKRFKYIG